MGDISIFRSYFEKEYKELGIDVHDSINTLYLKEKNILNTPNIDWVLYHSFNQCAFVGNNKHCCIVIASKYILWFIHPTFHACDLNLERSKDTVDHFFEDPKVLFESIDVDTTQKVLLESDRKWAMCESNEVTKEYDHIIDEIFDGYKCYLGEIPNGGGACKLSKTYNGYNLLITDVQYGDETASYSKLYVYKDLETINKNGSWIELESVVEDDPLEHLNDYYRFLTFKIYEDFTIRVDGRRKIGDKVDKLSRYYRIDDDGKIRELIGKNPL